MSRHGRRDAGDRERVLLPAHLAFVVQLAHRDPDGDRVQGRVEHVASGAALHFASWSQLRRFLSAELDRPTGGVRS